jgi:aerobic-type carbon monoxide dehydrogenase small subunit (CoxS/CutS family)
VSEHTIELTVNGVVRQARVEARRSLADVLRDDLRLTGTHLGCEHGVCGACTVLLDGEPARSCITLAVQADGGDVSTVESLGAPDDLHPLQQAFRDAHSFQCGYCTPGFVIESLALLRDNPAPTEREVREALAGNICRCTGYESIVRGVLLAAERTKEGP